MTEASTGRILDDLAAPVVRPVFTRHDRELRKNAKRSMIDHTLSAIVGSIHEAFIEGRRSVSIEMCLANQATMTPIQVTQTLRRQLQAWYGQGLFVELRSERMTDFSVSILVAFSSLE